MARIRSIKPEFFESEDVAALPLRARLTWIGLWVHCDNYGRCKDNVRLVKKNVWPLDQVSLNDVEEDLQILANHGRIVRYEVGGTALLAVVNWDRHQSIARPGMPKYPAPPLAVDNVARHDSDEALRSSQAVDNSRTIAPEEDQGHDSDEALRRTDASLGNREQGTGNREGNAQERASPPEPPRQCLKHDGLPSPPPCGSCADARRAHDAWLTERNKRVSTMPACHIHRGQLAHNCAGCRADQLAADA